MGNKRECTELWELLDKFVEEADKSFQRITQLKIKFNKEVCKVEAALSPEIRDRLKDNTKEGLVQLLECLINLNIDLELNDNCDSEFAIPPIPIEEGPIQLKFLTGDNPWSFWLKDQHVDDKLIQKQLLNKYQNDLLDPYCKTPEHMDSVCFLDRNKIYRGIVLQPVNENRVKLLDCDSNISKVIGVDKIFNLDPDASHIHGAALKCAISKDSNVAADLWLRGGSELRDMFCNILNEAVLNVKMIERVTDAADKIPFYVVNVDMQMEDEGSQGNLNDWIYRRLIPELKKVNSDENEAICSLLSDEALNPYCTPYPVVTQEINKRHTSNVCKDDEEASSVAFENKKTNNLNVVSNKMPGKVVANIEPSILESDSISDSSEQLVTSEENLESSSNVCVTDSNEENSDSNINKVLDNRLNYSCKEFKPNKKTPPKCMWQPRLNNESPVPLSGFNTSNQPSIPSDYEQLPQVPYHPWTSDFQVPHPRNYFQGPDVHQWAPPTPQTPSPMPIESPKSIASPQPSRDKSHANFKNEGSSNDQSTKVANINNISVNVNVMAKEFVPKQNTNKDCSANLSSPAIRHTNTPSLEQPLPKSAIVQVQLREGASLINPKDNVIVLISHVESPSEFYVHFINNNNKYLDTLKNQMFVYYNSRESVQFDSWREARRILGKYCACKWEEDNGWYRVEVLDWTPGDFFRNNKVKVKSVDYGNTMEVPWQSLQPLDQKFTKLAISAQRCHLAGVVPKDKKENWDEKAIEFFKFVLTNQEHCVFSVFVRPSYDQIKSLKVRLYQGKYTEDSISINQLLVDQGLAWSKSLLTAPSDSGQSMSQEDKPAHNNSTKCVSLSDAEYQLPLSLSEPLLTTPSDIVLTQSNVAPQLPVLELSPLLSTTSIQKSTSQLEHSDFDDTWDPLAADYFSPRNNPAINTDDPSVALIGYAPKDEQRICRFFAEKGRCWKLDSGKVCHKDHERPRSDGVTTDKEVVFYSAIEKLDLPSVGETLRVKVTSVIHMGLFYVQFNSIKPDDIDDDELETLGTLEPCMNEPEKIRQMKHLAVPPAIGQMVLAKYDNMWHRARVIGTADVDYEHEVMFVDFGTIATVSEADLRVMEFRYMHLPFQAVACSLANIDLPSNNTEEFDQGSALLSDAIENQNLTAKIYDSGDLASVACQLQVLLQFDNGIDVGEWLVDNKVCGHQPCSLSWDQ